MHSGQPVLQPCARPLRRMGISDGVFFILTPRKVTPDGCQSISHDQELTSASRVNT